MKASAACTLAVLFMISGYMLAVMSFREEVWVDYRSGARRTSCTLFPFSICQDHSNDSFLVLFGSSADENAEWGRVRCRHLVRWLDQEAITEGEEMVRGENYLVRSLLYKPAVRDEADTMSKRFYNELRTSGVSAAQEYAHGLYWNLAAQAEKEIERRNP